VVEWRVSSEYASLWQNHSWTPWVRNPSKPMPRFWSTTKIGCV
jgi:hypothetical protein